MKNDTLTRYAAVVPVFVDAGCADSILLKQNGGAWLIYRGDRLIASGCEAAGFEAVIAVLEQWFHQTVVPWFNMEYGHRRKGSGDFYIATSPEYTFNGLDKPTTWEWSIKGWWDGDARSIYADFEATNPDEEYIQCIEALAEVIGGKR